MASLTPLFEAEDLRYIYPDGSRALNGFSFKFFEGDSLALVGANGSGKSTLFMHLMGCLSQKSGSLKFCGREYSKSMLRDLRMSCAMLFQNPEDQLFLPTVEEDIAFGPRNSGLSDADTASSVERAIKEVGIEHLRKKSPWKLSGGEKTLAAIAGLLAMSPKVMLLDEPSAGLDPRSRKNLIRVVKNLSCSIIIATHDLDFAIDTCDRALFFKEGALFGESEIPGLFLDEKFMQECGLELPLRCSRNLKL